MAFSYLTGEPAKLTEAEADKDGHKDVQLVNYDKKQFITELNRLDRVAVDCLSVGLEFVKKYAELFGKMHAFYSDWDKSNIGLIPPERFSQVEYGVLYTSSGLINYLRVKLIVSSYEKNGIPIFIQLKFMDIPHHGPEKLLNFDPNTMKLFYLTPEFLQLEPRVYERVIYENKAKEEEEGGGDVNFEPKIVQVVGRFDKGFDRMLSETTQSLEMAVEQEKRYQEYDNFFKFY